MLQIVDIHKQYKTGNLVQNALDGVSLNLRDNEFVAILGPSGSGKTTFLNIVGGLDRYDSGDLIINGISTKKYTDRDWDSYRNHTIGFVFQSYNLIPHQNILSNVELALTISGVSKSERRKRAIEALRQVGLGDQLHKKPNQLSGGQMQRVAIARALVNDPDILLADEPTGALDSDTSVQVMNLLKEVAKDRLVVMVTHNPELAREYATRIVEIRDGKITSDSDPYILEGEGMGEGIHKNMGKASMSFLTALSLSFNNLRTKKARTILTAFAGSIGIIGIALILSLSNGVNDYIRDIEEETLSEYPLEITRSGLDFTSLLTSAESTSESGYWDEDVEVRALDVVSGMFSTVATNDLTSLRDYFESGESGIEEYVNAIEYTFDISPQIYRIDGDQIRQVNPDQSFSALGFGYSSNSMISSMMNTDVFFELPETEHLYINQYDVMAGHWPENYNECVLVLSSGGGISDFVLYSMGIRDANELDEMIESFASNESVEVELDMTTYSYDDFIGITFKLVDAVDYYVYDYEYDVWTDKSDNEDYIRTLVENGEDITITGVVMPSDTSSIHMLSSGIYYSPDLTKRVISVAEESRIVQEQISDPEINVLTGEPFGEESDEDMLDWDSLFSFDEDEMEDLFSFDFDFDFDDLEIDLDDVDISDNLEDFSTDDLDLESLGLEDMFDEDAFDDLDIDTGELPELDMSDLLAGMTLSISDDEMEEILTDLVEGFQSYISDVPEADMSSLGSDVEAYLDTRMAQSMIENAQAGMVQVDVDSDKFNADLKEAIRESNTGDVTSGDSSGFDLDNIDIPDIGNYVTVTVSADGMSDLAVSLVTGYLYYAGSTGAANPLVLADYFSEYLQSDEASDIIYDAMTSLFDLDSLGDELADVLVDYIADVMELYMDAIVELTEDMITEVMEELMDEIVDMIEESLEDVMTGVIDVIADEMSSAMEELSDSFSDFDFDEMLDSISFDMDEDDLMELMNTIMGQTSATYETNLSSFGYADMYVPDSIIIYPIDFDGKEMVVNILDDYNLRMEETGQDEKVVTYTDVVGSLMSSVTNIIDIISYVLIAFVAISLIVSSIMIGVITYISVLERRKEIGILRAMGASRGNISEVFNAETFIIGLFAGLLGVVISRLLLFPGNALIHFISDNESINAVLPLGAAAILVVLSVILTLIGGLIPSRTAAKSDPVIALRTE